MTKDEFDHKRKAIIENSKNDMIKLLNDYVNSSGLKEGDFVVNLRLIKLDPSQKPQKWVIVSITCGDEDKDLPELKIKCSKVTANGTIKSAKFPFDLDELEKWKDEEDKGIVEPSVGYIYLICSNDMYKIGFSTDPLRRLKQIQTHNPFKCELISTIKDTGNLESYLHEKFKRFRTNGEWFEKSNLILIEFNRMSSFEGSQYSNGMLTLF